MNITPSRVTVAGTVSGVDGFVNAFTVALPSEGSPGQHLQTLQIRAILNIKTGTISPPRRLPLLNSVVTFTGELIAVSNGFIVVAVDDISYFPRLRTIVHVRCCRHGRFDRGNDIM